MAKGKVPAALAAHQFGKSKKKGAVPKGGKKAAAKKASKPPWLK